MIILASVRMYWNALGPLQIALKCFFNTCYRFVQWVFNAKQSIEVLPLFKCIHCPALAPEHFSFYGDTLRKHIESLKTGSIASTITINGLR